MAETKERQLIIYAKKIDENLFFFKEKAREIYVERMLKELGMEHHFNLMKVRENREWRATRNNLLWLADSAEKVSGRNAEDVKIFLKDYFSKNGASAGSVKLLAKIAGEMRESNKEAASEMLASYLSVPKAISMAPREEPKAQVAEPAQRLQNPARKISKPVQKAAQPAQKKAVYHKVPNAPATAAKERKATAMQVQKPIQEPEQRVAQRPKEAAELGEVMKNYDSISEDAKKAYLEVYFKDRAHPKSVSDEKLKKAIAATYGSTVSRNDRMFWEGIRKSMDSLKMRIGGAEKHNAETAQFLAKKRQDERIEAVRSYRKAMSGNIDNFVKETDGQYQEILKNFNKIGKGTMTYRELFSKGTPEYNAIKGLMQETEVSYAVFKSNAAYLGNYMKSGNIDIENASKKMKEVSESYGKYMAILTAVAKKVEEYRVNSPLDYAGMAFDAVLVAALIYSARKSAPKAIAAYKELRLAAKQGVGATTKVALNSARKSLATSFARENLGKTVLKAVDFSVIPIGFGALAAGGESISILDIRGKMDKFGEKPGETVAEMKSSLSQTVANIKKTDMDSVQKQKAIAGMESSIDELSSIENSISLEGTRSLTKEETKRISSAFVNTAVAVAAIQLVFFLPAIGKAVTREITPAKVLAQATADASAGSERAMANIGSIFMENGMAPKANLANITEDAIAQARALKKAGKQKEAEAFLLGVGKELRAFKNKGSVMSFGKRAKEIIGISPLPVALPQRTAIMAGKAREGAITATKDAYSAVKEKVSAGMESTKTVYGKGRKIAKGAVDYFKQNVALDDAKGIVVSKYPEISRGTVKRNLTSIEDITNGALARARALKKADAREYLNSVKTSLEQGFSPKDRRMVEFNKEIKKIAG
jgi:hypothetical protein